MNIFTLNIPANTPEDTYTYTVNVYGYDNQWHNIYNGKVFIQEGQTTVNIELEDILWNHKFNGDGFMSPTINTSGDDFIMCSTSDSLSNYWFNSVQVTISGLVGAAQVRNICFFTDNMFGDLKMNVINGCIPFRLNHQPVSHIPFNAPTGFEFRQIVWNGTFTRKIDNTTTVFQRNKLGTIVFTGGTDGYYINDYLIAKIDQCSKPYYLVWMTNSGAMQCQPFTKSSELSVTYDNNNRIDMSNYEWNYNKSVKASWNLKSMNLKDSDYKAYAEMFNSPYLILLDIENSRLHYVNVTDTDYTLKKSGVNGNKMLYFEVKVQAAEVKTI